MSYSVRKSKPSSAPTYPPVFFGRASPPHVGGGVPRRTVPLRAPHTVRTARAPWCGPAAVGRDAWPPGLPAHAAAPSARCAAWHVAHAESFAGRGSVRGTVRGRAAHPARCHDRAAITHAITPGHGAIRRDGDIAPYRHYARKIRTAITHPRNSRAHYPAAQAIAPVDNVVATRNSRAHYPAARCAAWHRAPSWGAGVTGRRALRGPGAPAGGKGGARRRPRQNSQRVLLAITPAIFKPPLRTQKSHAHYPRAIARGGSPPRTAHPRHCPPPCVLVR